jgi:hypothetical protein
VARATAAAAPVSAWPWSSARTTRSPGNAAAIAVRLRASGTGADEWEAGGGVVDPVRPAVAERAVVGRGALPGSRDRRAEVDVAG